jgi:hypothetical protein
MRRLLAGGLALLLTAAALPAQDPPEKPDKPAASRAQQFRDIQRDWTKAQQDFFAAYRAAKTDAERQEIVDKKRPKPDEYVARAWKLIDADPKDAVAADALAWVMQMDRAGRDRAVKLLLEHHIASPKLADALNWDTPEPLLRTVMEKSPHKAVQAKAAFTLAVSLHEQGKDKEAEALFEKILADKAMAAAPNYRGTLGKAAEGYLFEIRNLAIGKAAPEVTGEDIEGQPLRLSDYRGKVVVLDFWGHW